MKVFKTIIVSFLAVSILSFSGGLNIVKHYCGETLKEISLNKESAACCGEHESENSTEKAQEDCCIDQVSFFKTFEFEKQSQPFVAALVSHSVQIKLHPFTGITKITSAEHYALPPPKLAIFKQVQRFLI